ncbi:hypothetical protein HY969_03970 [Candidatus Kaiserbacteria bacterium]|nr:hypothetical protein [Candidatus Kaiserbacteria bacterium]
MAHVWNKGLTKDSHTSILKISQTMRHRHIDNFAKWREHARRSGLLKSTYPEFPKNEDLAEFIGVVLGDGHIGALPRTESLRIVANSNNKGFVTRYAKLVEKIFAKKPNVKKRNGSEAMNITIYERHISRRLGIPSGARGKIVNRIPRWITENRKMIIPFLRGLYEAEGCYSVHKPTYTYKMFFSNRNDSLLELVFRLVTKLGFHPHVSKYSVQISKKHEVQKFKDLIEFRRY